MLKVHLPLTSDEGTLVRCSLIGHREFCQPIDCLSSYPQNLAHTPGALHWLVDELVHCANWYGPWGHKFNLYRISKNIGGS